jgi:hypothetical protein
MILSCRQIVCGLPAVDATASQCRPNERARQRSAEPNRLITSINQPPTSIRVGVLISGPHHSLG